MSGFTGGDVSETLGMSASFAFLPGASGEGSFWEPVQTALGADDAVLFDWPGFGPVPGDPTVAGYDDLASLVIERLTGPTVLVAQSMGGVVAVKVVQRRPDLVSHLVLAVTSGGIDLTPFTDHDWRIGSRAANPNNPPWMWEPTDDLSPVLAALPIKTLLLWATDDEISPLAVGQHLATLIPRSRLVAFPSDDHWVARIHADEVADAIADFVTPSIGFLHTAEAHVDTFENLLNDTAPDDLRTVHVVDESLLTSARELGPDDPSVLDAVEEALRDLVDEGVDLIVCTCSTIGGVAEATANVGVTVLRVDRPMAAAAVGAATHIAVVASVESTLAPTIALLHDECARQNRAPEIGVHPCLSAWAFWEAGDVAGYHHAVADHVEALGAQYDVVVLAQASMLGALAFIKPVEKRLVLASPSSAVEAGFAHLASDAARTASPRGETS
jgi:poly(3-hydroxyoctanoate) depolymerase